jgi:hypothetical protein
MAEENPYAPPSIGETEMPSLLDWKLEGVGLLVKNGATLPKIDLETGEKGDEMKSIHRILDQALLSMFLWALPFCGLGFFGYRSLKINLMTIAIAAVVILFVITQIQNLRGVYPQRVIAFEFIGKQREKRRRARYKWGAGLLLIIVVIFFSTPLLVQSLVENKIPVLTGLACTIALLGSIATWIIVDHPKAKTLRGPKGWMKISPIHPDAFTFLHQLEGIRQQEIAQTASPRKRLIRTSYLYRYPLRLLLWRSRKNPLLVIRISLMKVLKSPLLEQLSYHYSEAEKKLATELSSSLQSAINVWLTSHPSWSYLYGEELPSPEGSMTIQSATLISSELNHSVGVIEVSFPMKPGLEMINFNFSTWLIDGTLIVTYDAPYLKTTYPVIRPHFAAGSPEQVFQAHLQNCSGTTIDSPTNLEEVMSRIERLRKELDESITEMGLQSKVREFVG